MNWSLSDYTKKEENSFQGPIMGDLRFIVNCESFIKEMLHWCTASAEGRILRNVWPHGKLSGCLYYQTCSKFIGIPCLLHNHLELQFYFQGLEDCKILNLFSCFSLHERKSAKKVHFKRNTSLISFEGFGTGVNGIRWRFGGSSILALL